MVDAKNDCVSVGVWILRSIHLAPCTDVKAEVNVAYVMKAVLYVNLKQALAFLG